MSGWRQQAVCTGSPHLFFGPDDEPERDWRERVTKAGRICATCPVRLECISFARVRGLRFGVWGGEDFETASTAPEDPPVLCGNGLHFMTPENSKPIAGTTQVRCRECQRESDRRTRPARHARLRQRRREQRKDEAA